MPRRRFRMAASQTDPERSSRAQSECVYRSADSMNSTAAVDCMSERAAGVLARRGASGGSISSKGGAGVTPSVVGRIGAVGTGPMEGRRETSDARWSEVGMACAPWQLIVARWEE